jgi:hypothetical protein
MAEQVASIVLPNMFVLLQMIRGAAPTPVVGRDTPD